MNLNLQSQYHKSNLENSRRNVEALQIEEEKKEISNSTLKEIKWMGEWTLSALFENGIKTFEQLQNTPEEKLRQIVKYPFTLKNILSAIKS